MVVFMIEIIAEIAALVGAIVLSIWFLSTVLKL